MLSPKKVKWRKHQKGKNRGRAARGNTVTYGEYGLQATTAGFITGRQIEAARIAISRETKRGGRVFIKIFPDKVLTKKPIEVRMGKGKGSPEEWVAVIKPGRVLFEIGGVDKVGSLKALNLARYKLPVRTKVVAKIGFSIIETVEEKAKKLVKKTTAKAADEGTEVKLETAVVEEVKAETQKTDVKTTSTTAKKAD